MKPTQAAAAALLLVAALVRGATRRGWGVPRFTGGSRGGRDRSTILARRRAWNDWAAGNIVNPPGWGSGTHSDRPRSVRRGNLARKAARKRAARRWQRAALLVRTLHGSVKVGRRPQLFHVKSGYLMKGPPPRAGAGR